MDSVKRESGAFVAMPPGHRAMPATRLPKPSLHVILLFGLGGHPLRVTHLAEEPMIPPASDWRSLSGHDYLSELDRSGFAWEFLRRNPAYQEDYNTIMREAASDARQEGPTRDALVWRWGLSFPGRSKTSCRPSDRVLAAGDAAHDRFAGACCYASYNRCACHRLPRCCGIREDIRQVAYLETPGSIK